MNKKTLLLIFLLLSFIPFTALAQTITVGGRVISGEDGYGLPGVTIQVKGTQKGTVSDMDGNYSVQVASNGTLVFTLSMPKAPLSVTSILKAQPLLT